MSRSDSSQSKKKIIRPISDSKYNAHTEPIFKKLKLLNLDDMMKHNTLKFYYKLKNHKVPVYFENYELYTQEQIHMRNTRFNHLIPTNITRTNIQQKCLRNYLPQFINSTPQTVLEKVFTHSYAGVFTQKINILKFIQLNVES